MKTSLEIRLYWLREYAKEIQDTETLGTHILEFSGWDYEEKDCLND